MHMADALLSPGVGLAMGAVGFGLVAHCTRRVDALEKDRLVPTMGVLGAFVFAAQMINFTIPGTGSSGHLGGGLLLAVLLGPHAAFLVMTSVLTVQAFLFADGGILALGCNIFNLGFFPAFVAFPLIYLPLAGETRHGKKAWWAAVLAALVGLEAGAGGVVAETLLSGIARLPPWQFLGIMLGIHLPIALVEGAVTAAVVGFLAKARPGTLPDTARKSLEPALVGLFVATVFLGGGFCWFASTRPDGLEWSISRVTGKEELDRPGSGIHQSLHRLQTATAIFPDYSLAGVDSAGAPEADRWPNVRMGTSAAGIVGGAICLGLILLFGRLLKRQRQETVATAPLGHGP